MAQTFEFKQCVTLLKATGKTARSLAELRDTLAVVGEGSIFHHTYQYFLKGHILEYTNDFSHWVGESLEERALAEHLSNIDPYEFKTIDALRTGLLRAIDAYRAEFPEPRAAMERDEFYFNETVTLVFSAGIRARNLAEFLLAVKYVDVTSIYYHFYDARLRLPDRGNDFSVWFSELGKPELGSRIAAIDPFMHNLEGIRQQIADAVAQEVERDMESAGVTP